MKIGIIGIDSLSPGKGNIDDERLDVLKDMFKSAKKVCIQVDLLTEKEKLCEADGIIAPEQAKLDLIISDIEFVEARLERSADALEKNLFTRFKEILDKEGFLSQVPLSEEEKKLIAGYSLLTIKPVYLTTPSEIENKNKLLFSAYYHFGYVSFFTAGEKDAHAWPVRKGANAWEASGAIHSDIQKGFIRAEVVAYQDLINDQGLNQAKNNNHLRLENKEYLVQDGDYMVFRFNK
ncbi:MAG: DUF933 domain-containing protein [Candidatus Omnitrophota bacterium]|nr:DUF933 domain-containing protein [Candidatus Omnitrophota bacterium]MBU1928309.1 DUF933 domain-containing protein [Candidatus Omnitrophota bacterium]MBU2035535.1 DUF933 domain-containing protein [Candidatus Omnitrophota bacterium]MBU2221911.1 DUF933 domain-containing protein [Candidatus Omnitrophota bacterium]MBU2257485.1 DUF933 domain-containing protein [Candidatus Omnitrophota bacterium]